MSRSVHLGLDWGTSATKLVLRDYDAVGHTHGLSYVVRSADGGVRHPSLVVLESGRLWFGDSARAHAPRAEASWHALKADVALRGKSVAGAVSGLQLRDLAVLFLAHMLCVGRRAAERLPGGKDATMGFKLGVPTGEMNSWMYATEYVRIARAASFVASIEERDPDGMTIADVPALLKDAWGYAADREDRAKITGEVIEAWLRAEAASEMIWPFNTPSIQPGLYTAVDVGAGTTNACFFMIHARPGGDREKKGALSFFAAACAPPGLDDFITVLLRGDASPERVASMRGRENEVINGRPDVAKRLEPVLQEFTKVWFKARQQAWGNYPGNRHWDGLRLITVGGGRTLDLVRGAFESSPPVQNIYRYAPVHHLGVPTDLHELPRRAGDRQAPFTGDPTFLLTAYGLSFETDDLPEITLPSGIPPFKPAGRVRQFVSHEDQGYEKK